MYRVEQFNLNCMKQVSLNQGATQATKQQKATKKITNQRAPFALGRFSTNHISQILRCFVACVAPCSWGCLLNEQKKTNNLGLTPINYSQN